MPSPFEQRDTHGQPPRFTYQRRVEAQQLTEMLGICSGILFDGVVTDAEVEGLARWVVRHPDVVSSFPGKQLYARLATILEDGRVDEDERTELHALLTETTGAADSVVGETAAEDSPDRPTRLAFDDPTPTVFFDGRTFCFTGKFAYGGRAACEAAVIARGGRVKAHPGRDVDFVVIGTFSSDAWRTSQFGTKIEAAVKAREAGHPVRIIPEAHWVESVRYDE